MIYFLLFVLMGFPNMLMTSATSNRHVIYWNTHDTPGLAEDGYTLNVKIGDFMDVLCPQQSLINSNDLSIVSIFNLYNVTESEFNNCDGGDSSNFLFACDRPQRENKLTIKFQTISPSPRGFRFRYCENYYFVAAPRLTPKKSGCHNGTSRLRIKVACRDTTTMKTTTTTSNNLSSITPTFQPLDLDTYILLLEKLRDYNRQIRHDDLDYDTILVSQLRSISKQDAKELEKALKRIYSEDPFNFAPTTLKNTSNIFFLSGLFSLILSSLVTNGI